MRTWKRWLSLPAMLAGLATGTPASAAFISAAVGMTDFNEPSTFTVTFAAPVVPLFGLVSYTTTSSGTLTDGGTDGVFANVPAAPPSIFGFSINGSEFLTDSIGNVSASFGPVSYSGTFDCGVIGCSTIGLRIAFTGSGGSDQYAFLSRLELSQQSVPEPGTLALLGLGLAGLAARRMRRH